jgi:hypothetical protein
VEPLDVDEDQALVEEKASCWTKFCDFLEGFNLFQYDGVMNVYYDKDNEDNTVVTWKSKTACCLMFLFTIAIIFILVSNFLMIGTL